MKEKLEKNWQNIRARFFFLFQLRHSYKTWYVLFGLWTGFQQAFHVRSVMWKAGKRLLVQTLSNVKALKTEGKRPRIASYHVDIPSVVRHKVSLINWSLRTKEREFNRSCQHTLVGENAWQSLNRSWQVLITAWEARSRVEEWGIGKNQRSNKSNRAQHFSVIIDTVKFRK